MNNSHITRSALTSISIGVFILMTFTYAVQAATSSQWVRVADHAAFSERDSADGAVFLGGIWISNAYRVEGAVRDLWNSSDGVTWTKALDNTPYDPYAEMAVFQNKLWAVKGSVWNLTDGVKWTQVCNKTPFGPRGFGKLVVFQDKLWRLDFGYGIWCSCDGVNWTRVLAKAPYGQRTASAVTVYAGKLWLCGGSSTTRCSPLEEHYTNIATYNDVWCSSDGANWTRVIEHAPWLPRMWVLACEYAGKLWIIGGFSNRETKNFADCWTTTDGMKWEEFKFEAMWSPRHQPTIYIFKDSLWLVGGDMWPPMMTNDVWKLTIPDGGKLK